MDIGEVIEHETVRKPERVSPPPEEPAREEPVEPAEEPAEPREPERVPA